LGSHLSGLFFPFCSRTRPSVCPLLLLVTHNHPDPPPPTGTGKEGLEGRRAWDQHPSRAPDV
jgi:hypothetical protein